ncbi:XdhC family protein [Methylocystis sp. SC2]|uniref:XdhC family protein n=1 Tax=Methylocystis sp. (strain SC2) TaxID=187303 RepID=UPI00027AF15B|nr:XdhC family protein [Methylocystis sp. SC2]CCJ08894.1 XdhC/CoxI family protein [Methylocystis sp. SC2]
MNCVPDLRQSRDALTSAHRWLEDFGQVALATVVSTWGSSPVPVGGQMAIGPDGQFEGSVSGGCVEAEVIAEAADILTRDMPKLLEFGVGEELAWRAGLPCGGAISIYVEPLRHERDSAFLERVFSARRARTSLAVLTTLASGERRLFDAGEPMPAEIAQCLISSESRVTRLDDDPVFLHALTPPVRVIIVGATHVGQVLADLTNRIGYDVVIVDPRAAFASADRVGDFESLTDWPEISLKRLGLDPRTAVVALTHAAAIDDEALTEALRSHCLYIGALGSTRTHAKRLQRLAAAGFNDTELARISAPIGLPIGAKGPAEIAVSILAEIVQVARGTRPL